MDDVKSISKSLCRMVDIALQVYQCRLLLEFAVFGCLFNGINDLMHVSVALSDVHIVTDTDHVRHEGDHGSCLADRLAVCDLRLLFIEIRYL